MKLTILLLLLFISGVSFSQSTINVTKPKEGTYQIIVQDSKETLAFSSEFLYGLEAERKENEDVTIEMGKNIFVFLPSRKSIVANDFKPLDPVVQY